MPLNRTVCEMFAGVGGFRCGLNAITTLDDTRQPERWQTVWFSQWEPADKTTQWAHACYVNRFGTCLDLNGQDTTNVDINAVNKHLVPDHNLLVGGFPCQDYSVAASLATSRGLEGRKGILWWDIRDMLEAKEPPFVLLENVDRLIKSPAKQRGRDFGVILACFRDLGYTVEWRIINAAEYGCQQRRRRTFIFAYRDDTAYATRVRNEIGYVLEGEIETNRNSVCELLLANGFFANCFPVMTRDARYIQCVNLPIGLGELSEHFAFDFENSGVMIEGKVYTLKTTPNYDGGVVTLGDILEEGPVDENYFIPEEQLYYTNPAITHSDETHERLPDAAHRTWQYIKGAKKLLRRTQDGHEYVFSEGAISMIDSYNQPARTMLTSEGSFGRSTHIVRDRLTGRIRLLTPVETERIQGFPDNWTRECLVNGQIVEMPVNKRRFMMGNALVVNLISRMEPFLSQIFEAE